MYRNFPTYLATEKDRQIYRHWLLGCFIVKPNCSEWDAVMEETTPVEQWAGLLPRQTLVVSDPDTVLPIRATALLRRACLQWTYTHVTGGHMAPLTHPEIVNPLVRPFLQPHAQAVDATAASAPAQ